MTPDTLARIMAYRQMKRGDLVIVVLFARGHPQQSITRALWDFLHGIGPAAVAAGRYVAGGVRLAPARVETLNRETREAA